MDQREAHFEIYPEMNTAAPREPTGNYRWRFREQGNREITAESGQGFGSRGDANRAIHDFMSQINREHPHPPILDMDEHANVLGEEVRS